MKKKLYYLLCILFSAALLSSCEHRPPRRVVAIYVSVDQVYAEPILKSFEKKTGIKVLTVYDVEATKTSGMVNRLIAEKARPQADVFWNGEFAQTLLLKEQGVLTPYRSEKAKDIPVQYLDPDEFWTAFGGRARVILVNKDLVAEDEMPDSVYDLLSDKWKANRVAISSPIFGTSATQAAAMYAALGRETAKKFYQEIKTRGIRIVDGNSVAKDLVIRGELDWAFVDSDDACVALQEGNEVEVIFPDQDSFGTLIIPATVALIAGSPHPQEAKALIDYLLDPETELQLIKAGLWQMSLRPQKIQSPCCPETPVKGMSVSLDKVMRQVTTVRSAWRCF